MAEQSEDLILVIDMGTSGPKVALATGRGDIVACEFEPTPVLFLPGGGAEQDPEGWWRAVVAATRRLLAHGLAPVDSIIAVSATTQWSGTVPVDADGRALGNALLWLDSRGADAVRALVRGPVQVQGYALDRLLAWIRLTGGVPGLSGKDPLAHILYLRRERPEVFAAARKFLEPKDYLNLRLTGLSGASVDSITLHWVTDNRDLRRVDYHPTLLRWTGLPREKLPDLCRAVDVLGPLAPAAAQALGLRPGLPVLSGTPDVHSAAIGSGAVRDGAAHLYLGTSAWFAAHVPFKKSDLLHNMASLPSALPGRYLLIAEQEAAGSCLTWLRDRVFFPADALAPDARAPDDAFARLDQLAASAPAGSGGVIFTPWLYGERAPVDDHTLRGAFLNQSLTTTRAHLVRAVLEGVALNARWLLGHVEAFVGRRLDAIPVVGGGAGSALWCQILADVLDRPIRQVRDPIRANLRGAALLAAVGLGRLRWDDVAGEVAIARTFTPEPAHRRLYAEAFREFVRFYHANRGMYARLNGRR